MLEFSKWTETHQTISTERDTLKKRYCHDVEIVNHAFADMISLNYLHVVLLFSIVQLAN